MNMETKFTPGPWQVVGEIHDVTGPYEAKWPLYCADVYAEQPDGYCKNLLYLQSSDHLGDCSSKVSREEAKANARLIAEAPAMFALLRDLEPVLSSIECGHEKPMSFGLHLENVRALLAKLKA